MAKYFLILFSLMLSLSISVFIVSNFTDFNPTQVVSMIQNKIETVTQPKVKKEEIAITENIEAEAPEVTSTKSAELSEDQANETATEEIKAEAVKTEAVATTENPTENIADRFQPEQEKEDVEVKKPVRKEKSLDLKQFYVTQIKPIFKKIFGEEEVVVKTQNIETQTEVETPVVSEENPEEIKPLTEVKTAKTEVTKATKETAKVATPSVKKDIKADATPKAEITKNKKATETKPQAKWQASPKGTGWTIQIAAFRTDTEAQTVAKQLEAEKISHHIYETEVDGATWYRVNIGPFESPGAAAAYKQSRNIGKRFKGAFVRKL